MEIKPLLRQINQYIERHPELKLANQDYLLSVLLDRKIITKEEHEKLKGVSLFGFNEETSGYDIGENMGFIKNSDIRPDNCVEKPVKTHRDTSLVLIDEDGTVDKKQFELENLKKRFDRNIYNVKEEIANVNGYKYRTIYVTNKKTGIVEYEYNMSRYSTDILKRDSKGNNLELVTVNERFSNSNKYNNSSVISSIAKFDRTGKDYIMYEFKSFKNIKEIRRYDKNGDYYDLVETTVYSDGKPYETIRNGKIINNRIADKLISLINNKNLFGDIKNPRELENVIINITSENVYEVLTAYKNKTGRDLIDDIQKAENKNKKTLNSVFSEKLYGGFLINKLRNRMEKSSLRDNSDNEINYITDRIIDDLSSSDKKTLYEDIKLICSDPKSFISWNTVTERVLIKIREKNPSGNGLLTELANNKNIDDNEKAQIIPLILLSIGLIRDEKTLDEAKSLFDNKELIDAIINNCGKYCEDIKADMKLNQGNYEKLFIDLKRLYLRGQSNDERSIVSEPNGKIDVDFKQGNTGDCWLLAGLIAICKKGAGKSLVESLLKVDKKTGDVTVTFKGVNKTYVISNDEIKNSNYLSGGDGDVRAVELAFDKYIRELAYNKEDGIRSDVDICGNTAEYLFSVLLGKAEQIEGYSKDKNWKFNSETDYYCLGCSGYDLDNFDIIKNAVIKENGEREDFVIGHAYAIIGSDENYVYLINPWNSSETLKITHEKLHELKPSIGHKAIA